MYGSMDEINFLKPKSKGRTEDKKEQVKHVDLEKDRSDGNEEWSKFKRRKTTKWSNNKSKWITIGISNVEFATLQPNALDTERFFLDIGKYAKPAKRFGIP